MKKRKKILQYTLYSIILLSVLLLFLGLVELYSSNAYYKYRDTLKGEIRAVRLKEPFKNTDSKNLTPLGNQIRFRTDSNRFILPYNNLDSADYRIFFVGGSTTECATVDEDERIHVRTAQILNDTLPDKISCVNIGVSGNHSMLTTTILHNQLLEYQPDILVINHNVNDISILANHGSYWNKDNQRSLIVENSDDLFQYKVGYPKHPLIRKYFPYTALVLFPTFFETSLIPDYGNQEKHDKSKLTPEEINKTFKSSILSLVNMCKAWEVTPVLFTQAENFDEEFEEPYSNLNVAETHALLNRTIRAIAQENNIVLIDAEKYMKNQKNYFVDCVHYSNEGSTFISHKIASIIFDSIFNTAK